MRNFALIIVLLAVATAATADNMHVVYPKHDPPVDRPYFQAPAAAPDCAGATSVTVDASLDMVIDGTTTSASSLVDAYACQPWQETGPEFVVALEVTEAVYLYARVFSVADLDLFLLDSCDSDACLASHALEFSVQLSARPEPYYLVVDGYLGDAGDFSLTLSASASGLPAAVCADALISGCGDTPVVIEGDLYETPDQLTIAPCYPFTAAGGDDWIRLTIQSDVTFTADLTGNFFDGILWLYESCGPTADCLDFADEYLSENGEQLEIVNDSGETVVWYLGVDATKPAELGLGAYTLTLSCAGQVTSNDYGTWGRIKTLYR
jgi:hypothetical protein